MRICPRHNARMVVQQQRGWKYFACPVGGCQFIRAFKWQRTSKRALGQHDRAARTPAKATATFYGGHRPTSGSPGAAGKQRGAQ